MISEMTLSALLSIIVYPNGSATPPPTQHPQPTQHQKNTVYQITCTTSTILILGITLPVLCNKSEEEFTVTFIMYMYMCVLINYIIYIIYIGIQKPIMASLYMYMIHLLTLYICCLVHAHTISICYHLHTDLHMYNVHAIMYILHLYISNNIMCMYMIACTCT